MFRFFAVFLYVMMFNFSLAAFEQSTECSVEFFEPEVITNETITANHNPTISDDDLDILIVIVHGVAFDETEPTQETKEMVWTILNRNKIFTTGQAAFVAEEFIEALRSVLIHTNYFLKDALKTLKTGKPVHSAERLNYENFLLASNDITSDFVGRAYNAIEGMTKGNLVIVPELGPMTKTNIEFLLSSINTADARILDLFALTTKTL